VLKQTLKCKAQEITHAATKIVTKMLKPEDKKKNTLADHAISETPPGSPPSNNNPSVNSDPVTQSHCASVTEVEDEDASNKTSSNESDDKSEESPEEELGRNQ